MTRAAQARGRDARAPGRDEGATGRDARAPGRDEGARGHWRAFARHEARLAWRDAVALLSRGSAWRAAGLLALGIVFVASIHVVAEMMLADWVREGFVVDRRALSVSTFTMASAASLMLSQSLEAVTRAFYARGDLELVLSSPAPAAQLFGVRILGILATVLAMALVLAAPFVNVLVWHGGARWLGAFAVLLALAAASLAAALAIAVALFRALGAARTRFVAQVVAAVTGAGFAVALQFVAVLTVSTQAPSLSGRFAAWEALTPGPDSALWWPARALLGDVTALAVGFVACLAGLALAIRVYAPRFGTLVRAAAGAGAPAARTARPARLHGRTPAQALRRKEWALLLRDPWLASQSMMQLLYLAPVAFVMWRGVWHPTATPAVIAPVLVIAAGQLAGGLAWLAVSGEDAPDLIATAPIGAGAVLRAKAEAVIGAIAVVFAPLALALALVAPMAALAACAGVAAAAASATAIQFRFRIQARRSQFRRRQTSSRIANFAEALASIGWAGCVALAIAGTWLALMPAAFALAALAATGRGASGRRAVARSRVAGVDARRGHSAPPHAGDAHEGSSPRR
ncbi:MAG: hypothetical protein U1E86_15745 [Burkholderiaceae bacterium]